MSDVPPLYEPSVLCRLIGHRWMMTLRNYGPESMPPIWKPGAPRFVDKVHEVQTHCLRCGVPNPACR